MVKSSSKKKKNQKKPSNLSQSCEDIHPDETVFLSRDVLQVCSLLFLFVRRCEDEHCVCCAQSGTADTARQKAQVFFFLAFIQIESEGFLCRCAAAIGAWRHTMLPSQCAGQRRPRGRHSGRVPRRRRGPI